MKLITYEKDSKSFIGSIDEGGIVAFDNDPSIPKDMLGFLTIHNSDLLKRIIDYNYTLRDDLDK